MKTDSSRFDFLGLPLDSKTMEETLNWVDQRIQSGGPPAQHTVVNAAKAVNAQKDYHLKKSIQESHLINADGQAIVWGARILGIPVPERVTGIDLMTNLFALAERNNYPVYFLGAKKDVLYNALQNIQRQYPHLKIAGSHDGYFSKKDEAIVANGIKESGARILFVGMPTPKKENFINAYLDFMNVPFSMGVGGSFDILAGITKRAPKLMQKAGLEWFYRLSQEPRRLFGRYAKTNGKFIYLVGKDFISASKKRRKKGLTP